MPCGNFAPLSRNSIHRQVVTRPSVRTKSTLQTKKTTETKKDPMVPPKAEGSSNAARLSEPRERSTSWWRPQSISSDLWMPESISSGWCQAVIDQLGLVQAAIDQLGVDCERPRWAS